MCLVRLFFLRGNPIMPEAELYCCDDSKTASLLTRTSVKMEKIVHEPVLLGLEVDFEMPKKQMSPSSTTPALSSHIVLAEDFDGVNSMNDDSSSTDLEETPG